MMMKKTGLRPRIKAFFDRKSTRSEFIKYFLYGFFSLAVIVVLMVIALSPGLPGFDRLEKIYDDQTLSTIIFSDDGEVLRTLSEQKRIWKSYDQISKTMIDAVIAAEDTRFYKHWGISLPDIGRAISKNILHFNPTREGGSTITQQLARDQFLTRKKSLFRKLQEAFLAVKIEHTYSKPEIMELFLNRMSFSNNLKGIEAAAQGYFGKPASELGVAESALLAGMLQAPTRNNPRNHPGAAEERRNTVLMMMVNAGVITDAVAHEEMAKPIELASLEGLEYGKAPYFSDYVKDQLLNKFGDAGTDSLGLKVYTTLDYRLQKIAEEVLKKQLDFIQKNYADKFIKYHRPRGLSNTEAVKDSIDKTVVQGALVAIDVKTGAILAMIGGKKYDYFNRAVTASRQAGSSFKPFVFAAALDNGWKCSDTILDTYYSLRNGDGTIWAPQNYEGGFSGSAMTLRDGFKKSVNIIAAKLVNERSHNGIGAGTVVKYAKAMGITTEVKPWPSIAIGTAPVKLIDLTAAYTVFPNLGIRTEPFAIKTIKDKNDNQKFHEMRGRRTEALRPEIASLMVTMMESVTREGTAATKISTSPMRDRPCGGKTGTGNEYKDTWFVGYTPYICCGVWIGFNSEETTLNRTYGTGSAAPLPVWIDFMTKASDVLKMPKSRFVYSNRISAVQSCKVSHLRATPNCPRTYTEYYVSGTEITRFCNLHGSGWSGSGSGARTFSSPETEKKKSRGF
ncbi:MAG: PBP1A family penicillin-binding protein [Candidatus Latescibacterota bacterium]